MKKIDEFVNKIIYGNCIEVMHEFPDNSIDLTLTSPPYDDLREYGGHKFDFVIFKKIARELYRITKKGGIVVWVVGDATIKGSETGTSFKQALYFKAVGFNLHDTMIYESEKPPLSHNRYEQKFEYMFVFSKEKPKTFNPIKIKTTYKKSLHNYNLGSSASIKEKKYAMRKRNEKTIIKKYKFKGNIWKYVAGSSSAKDKIAYQHPAIFPEQLAKDHIISWSNKGDIVLDPMCGSGTTCKMAKKYGRNFIGIEIEKSYVEIARKRIKKIQSVLI